MTSALHYFLITSILTSIILLSNSTLGNATIDATQPGWQQVDDVSVAGDGSLFHLTLQGQCLGMRIVRDAIVFTTEVPVEKHCQSNDSQIVSEPVVLKVLTQLSSNYFHNVVDDLLPLFRLGDNLRSSLQQSCHGAQIGLYFLPGTSPSLPPKWSERYRMALSAAGCKNVSVLDLVSKAMPAQLATVVLPRKNNRIVLPARSRHATFTHPVVTGPGKRLQAVRDFAESTISSLTAAGSTHPRQCDLVLTVVWITRCNASRRKVINEEDVLSVIGGGSVAMNTTVASFDKMSWESQVMLMSRADVLIGAHGAGLTNMIFMPEGGTVIELFPNGFHRTTYSALAGASGLRHIALSADIAAAQGVCTTLAPEEGTITNRVLQCLRDQDIMINPWALLRVIEEEVLRPHLGVDP